MRTVTVVFCIFVAVPLVWLVYAAFIPAEAIVRADLSTFGFSLENFLALPDSGLWQAMGVSFAATGTAVFGQVLFGLGAAYAIRNGLKIQALVLALLALPGELLLVPLYRQLGGLGLRYAGCPHPAVHGEPACDLPAGPGAQAPALGSS